MSKNFSMFGLPEDVVFCSKCVMSNQRPRSVVEFKNSINQPSCDLSDVNIKNFSKQELSYQLWQSMVWALKLFEKIVVAVSDGENKDYLFDVAPSKRQPFTKVLFFDVIPSKRQLFKTFAFLT